MKPRKWDEILLRGCFISWDISQKEMENRCGHRSGMWDIIMQVIFHGIQCKLLSLFDAMPQSAAVEDL